MPVTMTSNQRAVLADVVVDADAWLSHAESVAKIDTQTALDAKVLRCQAAYDARIAAGSYRNRAQRDADEAQRRR